jgi:hypothetical protein
MPPSADALTLTAEQQRIVSFPREGKGSLAVRGLPGSGKTTALCARLGAMLREGRRPYEILVLLPQRAQAERFERSLALLAGPTRGGAEIVTFYSLVRRAVNLFWPLIVERAGFHDVNREPVFLTLETAQYYLWRVVEPLIREQGYFSDVAIPRGRLLSQLIDNLNKSALGGFDHTDIYARLKGAWTGSSDHLSRFWQAQDCASRFRQLCLEQNLLDFSLTTEVYCRYLLPHEVYRRYAQARYRHLLVDNVEENVPVAHDLIAWMMDWCQSTVLVLDERGGHRVFLGADAEGASVLAERCTERLDCARLFHPNEHLLAFADAVGAAVQAPAGFAASPQGKVQLVRVTVGSAETRFWIGMVRWVAEQVAELIGGGAAPRQIALVAPYVSEVMRFAIQEELAQRGVGLQLLRPATQLRDDPVIRGLLSLLWLAHPDWEIEMRGQPYALPREDVALALEICLAALDPIRARYLAAAAVRDGQRLGQLSGKEAGLDAAALARLWQQVGFQVREPYETLRQWLDTYQQGAPELPHVMLSRLFGDLLSRPGFGFYQNRPAARAYGRLVESMAKFSDAVATEADEVSRIAREYVQLILAGVASAEYLLDWPRPPREDAVLLAPAYAYITRDVRTEYQFWLDLGSDGWWNRPNQPLTNPYVLSRRWPLGRPWRDVEEEASRRETLGRVLTGLAARCHGGIYLAFSELGIDGSEQRGRLQMAVVSVLARILRHA